MRPSAQELLMHPWILQHVEEQSTLSLRDRQEFMDRLIKFKHKSSFFKVITSVAIGHDLDKYSESPNIESE